MYEIPGDHLMTYDPDFLEQHSDSSNFEESCIPVVSTKNGNHSFFTSTDYRQKPKNKEFKNRKFSTRIQSDSDQFVNNAQNEGREEYTWETKTVQASKVNRNPRNVDKEVLKQYKKIKAKTFHGGDQIEVIQSKQSFTRHKLIPCLSSMFGRSANNTKHMSVIEENQTENVVADKGYQMQCDSCERRRLRKLNRRQQQYAVQPVYAIEGNPHGTSAPFGRKIKQAPLPRHHKTYMESSSSESDIEIKERKKSAKKFKERLKYIRKEYLKHQPKKQLKHEQEQYPSKQNPYQVFTTPYQHSRTDANISQDSDSAYFSEMPSNSSGFWDYLFDRFHRKYQTQRAEMSQPCEYSDSQSICTPGNCQYVENRPDHSRSRKQNNCGCNAPPARREKITECCQRNERQSGFSDQQPMKRKSPQMKPVQCKCHPGKGAKPMPATEQCTDQNKPCQEPHDELASYLTDKYNAEVLCIHNPPCIVINGCLKIPQAEQQQTDAWPVTQDKKGSLYRTSQRKNRQRNCEQACQYHASIESDWHKLERTTEKQIQSICDHDPPCEVVRGCYRPRYDPKLQNSCVHVPMCQKFPECAIGRRKPNERACEHRPRCVEIPICSRNYTVLTATETVSTQIKPKINICRHEPPCVMIPKCLGRVVYDNYFSFKHIPGCVHQPLCDMVPACCRKSTRDMVSVCTQYPNSCRIV